MLKCVLLVTPVHVLHIVPQYHMPIHYEDRLSISYCHSYIHSNMYSLCMRPFCICAMFKCMYTVMHSYNMVSAEAME